MLLGGGGQEALIKRASGLLGVFMLLGGSWESRKRAHTVLLGVFMCSVVWEHSLRGRAALLLGVFVELGAAVTIIFVKLTEIYDEGDCEGPHTRLGTRSICV